MIILSVTYKHMPPHVHARVQTHRARMTCKLKRTSTVVSEALITFSFPFFSCAGVVTHELTPLTASINAMISVCVCERVSVYKRDSDTYKEQIAVSRVCSHTYNQMLIVELRDYRRLFCKHIHRVKSTCGTMGCRGSMGLGSLHYLHYW